MKEKIENFQINFIRNNEEHTLRLFGEWSEIRTIYEGLPVPKSLWLENEYGTHNIDIFGSDE